jgi:cyclopropane-fatty-acyl-phospholipid synthase
MESITTNLAENGYLPDFILRRGIRQRCFQVLSENSATDDVKLFEKKMDFIQGLKDKPIAVQTATANKQVKSNCDLGFLTVKHYEVPTEFFKLVMGKNMKFVEK